jgi:DNA-binding beta-propeller fold protein YncE
MKELKGQVVLIDFWTYCCINCMHVFPDLAFLEDKYKDKPLVVIGVHSGKFDQEKDAEHIKNAVLRHNIAHPVAVDSDYAIWNSYGVRSWPTLVVVDPEGYVVGGLSGEGHREQLDAVVAKLMEIHAAKGTLAKSPLSFKREREKFQSGVLEFPGKVLADAPNKRLFIADTNHHRVLAADLDGKVSDIYGDGKIGLKDGPAAAAEFYQPQGMALAPDGKTLFVADTENHAVRSIDLEKKAVTTIAGTGKQTYERNPDGPGKETALSSPWDLVLIGTHLYVAMAGTHQIWTIDLLKNNTVKLHSGTGRESAVDGAHPAAAFAQPSGLSTDGKKIYEADSVASTIRVLDADPAGGVTSLAGSNDLFGFGLVNGAGKEARFQHPLGVALDQQANRLFVADSFNNVIRTIDLKTNKVDTFLGTGKSDPGTQDAIGFYEPGGLSLSGGTLYIADTNHHRVVAVDVAVKKVRVVKVEIKKPQ